MTTTEKVLKVTPNTYARPTKAQLAELENQYQQKALDFLLVTDSTCSIQHIGRGFPAWGDKELRDHYLVSLSNKKDTLQFEFFGSIQAMEKNELYTFNFYSVLACLTVYIPESFDDFIGDYGYTIASEKDYITTKGAHLELLRQANILRKMYNVDQLDLLADIC